VIDWREVDGQLRSLAVRRAALDAEEARLLREAERLQIWRPLGMVSVLDYMERVLGYTPHVAMERLRVARSLESLPVLEAALGGGRLNFSAVRELTRVATPSTEAAWCASAMGKNVRQIEELVAGHAPGDAPDDPTDPALQRYKLTLDLSADVYARWRQIRTTFSDDRGTHLDDEALLVLMEASLDRGSEPTGRAKFQILMTLCKQCERGWQQGGGREILVDAPTVERAKCDAQYIGSMDDPLPVRAAQDIPPSIVRYVWHRDGGRCTTPGCRSTVGLEIHHGIPRALGGSHHPVNLGLKCFGCHSSIHHGTLVVVNGEARRPNEPSRVDHPMAPAIDEVTSHVGRPARVEPAPSVDPAPTGIDEAPLSLACGVPTPFDVAAMRAQARDALVGLGWKPGIARNAVDEAMSHVGRDEPIEALIREALRRCPRGTG